MKEGKKVKAGYITENLLGLGLVEKVGYGKWMLSKKYYVDAGQKGEYTRRKGFSKMFKIP